MKYILLIVFIISSCVVDAQSNLETFYVKVVALDTSLVDEIYSKEVLNRYPRVYFYSSYSINTISYKNDSMWFCIIYNTIEDNQRLLSNFNLKEDSTYQIKAYKFYPCVSDFKNLYGCNYRDSIYYPPAKSIIKTQYQNIYRIVEIVGIDNATWDYMNNYYKPDSARR
jgi:hypothetical protein